MMDIWKVYKDIHLILVCYNNIEKSAQILN